jgi:chaperonin GroEL (HSP60 family)
VKRLVGPDRPGDTAVEGQDISDGVVTRVLIAGSLLDRAESLIERGFHPQTILRGYDRARDVTVEQLISDSRDFESFDDVEAAKLATARCAMTGNDVGGQVERWATLAVAAVDIVGMPDEISFAVRQTRSGTIADSRLISGAVLDRSERSNTDMPRHIDGASVLVIDGHDRGGLQERDAPDEATVDLSSGADAADFDAARRDRKQRIVEDLLDAGVDVVVARRGIDPDYQRLLADNGILGVRGVTPLDLGQVAAATGASPVLDVADVTSSDLGIAGAVYQEAIEARDGQRRRRKIIVFEECPDPESVAVMLYGSTGELSEQAITGIRKAAHAVALADGASRKPGGVVPGGGACHCRIAAAVRTASAGVDSRETMAMETYADAAESVLSRLARNAGLDPLIVVPDVRAAQDAGDESAGLTLPSKAVTDCFDTGVLDPAGLVIDAYHFATAVATLILRVDDAIDAEFSTSVAGPDDVIYDEPAERQQRELERREDS